MIKPVKNINFKPLKPLKTQQTSNNATPITNPYQINSIYNNSFNIEISVAA